MKYSICIDALFNGRDFEQSMEAIKSLGFDTIEFWLWWNRDLDNVLRIKERLNMDVFGFCAKFVSLTDASKRKEYAEGLKESVKAAQKVGATHLITQVGNEIPGISRKEQHVSIVQGLKECAKIVEDAGITLVFEPLNTLVDHKGYYLDSSEEAFEICDEVGSGNVKVLYDIYHQQIMEGNLIANITANIDKIGHFHAAGNPGRHELHIGEINYRNIFKAITDAGYKGYMGLEYFPSGDPVKGLSMLYIF